MRIVMWVTWSLCMLPQKRKGHNVHWILKCPECDFLAVKAKDLYMHIKTMHPEVRPYGCWSCKKNFRTDHDHLNHMNSLHRDKQFCCKVCPYSSATESRMLDHVWMHTSKKFECTSCDVKLATKLVLQCHTLLHLSDMELRCDQCGKIYASKLALTIHKHGKHGDGYQCSHCQKVFDAPIKKARHLWKCKEARSKSVDAEVPTESPLHSSQI